MNKQQILEEMDNYIDQTVDRYKFELFDRYVRSKKVKFEEWYFYLHHRNTLLYGKSKTGNTQKIYFRTYKHRIPKEMKCTCADWRHRLKKEQKPCKHLFALLQRYQTKRNEIHNL